MNKNDKVPFFSPATQRVQITEDTPVDTLVITLEAQDPDLTDNGTLIYSILQPISAVDKDGRPVDPENLVLFW